MLRTYSRCEMLQSNFGRYYFCFRVAMEGTIASFRKTKYYCGNFVGNLKRG